MVHEYPKSEIFFSAISRSSTVLVHSILHILLQQSVKVLRNIGGKLIKLTMLGQRFGDAHMNQGNAISYEDQK